MTNKPSEALVRALFREAASLMSYSNHTGLWKQPRVMSAFHLIAAQLQTSPHFAEGPQAVIPASIQKCRHRAAG